MSPVEQNDAIILLMVGDVAERLRTTPRAVYDMVQAGLLPAVRVGRFVRFQPRSLSQWIEQGGARYGQPRPARN